jgi:hypothetical protein
VVESRKTRITRVKCPIKGCQISYTKTKDARDLPTEMMSHLGFVSLPTLFFFFLDTLGCCLFSSITSGSSGPVWKSCSGTWARSGESNRLGPSPGTPTAFHLSWPYLHEMLAGSTSPGPWGRTPTAYAQMTEVSGSPGWESLPSSCSTSPTTPASLPSTLLTSLHTTSHQTTQRPACSHFKRQYILVDSCLMFLPLPLSIFLSQPLPVLGECLLVFEFRGS